MSNDKAWFAFWVAVAVMASVTIAGMIAALIISNVQTTERQHSCISAGGTWTEGVSGKYIPEKCQQ